MCYHACKLQEALASRNTISLTLTVVWASPFLPFKRDFSWLLNNTYGSLLLKIEMTLLLTSEDKQDSMKMDAKLAIFLS